MKNIKNLILTICLLAFANIKSQTVAISPQFYGINAWYIDATGLGTNTFAATFTAQLLAVKASGVEYVRIGGNAVNWNQLYDFDNTLAITDPTRIVYLVEKIREAGMEPIIQVSVVPPTFTTSCSVYNSQSGYEALGNLSVDDQAAVAGNLVHHLNVVLKLGLKFWVVANEPDLAIGNCSDPQGYGLSAGSDAATIASYIKTFSTHMKEWDPQIQIIGPEVASFSTDDNGHDMMAALLSNPTASASTSILGKITDANFPNAVGQYFVDIVSFHYYPGSSGSSTFTDVANVQSNPTHSTSGIAAKISTTVSGRTGIVDMILAASAGRDISNIRVAGTEFNIDADDGLTESTASYSANVNSYDNRGFAAGQWLCEVFAECIKKQSGGNSWMQLMNLWSVKEGECKYDEPGGSRPFGYISSCSLTATNLKRPMYWHYEMMAGNFRGVFYPVSANNQTATVKTFAARSNDRIAVLIMNHGTSDHTFEVDLNGTPTSTAALNLGFTIPAAASAANYVADGTNSTTKATIKGNSTVLLLYNCVGNPAARYDYTKANVIANPTAGPVEVSIGNPLIGATLSSSYTTITSGQVKTVTMSPSTYTYTWSGPCGPMTPSVNGTVVELSPCLGSSTAIYTFTAIDGYGCSETQQFSVTPWLLVPNDPYCTLGPVKYTSSCAASNGSVAIATYNFNSTPYFKWDNGSSTTTDYTTGLAVGRHTVNVSSADVIEYPPNNYQPFSVNYYFYVPIDKSSLPPVSAGVDKLTRKSCSVTLSAWPNHELGGYTYHWYKGSSAIPTYSTNTCSFVVWSSDTYRVKVTDNSGCVNWDEVKVTSILPACGNNFQTLTSGLPCDDEFNSTYRSMMPSPVDTLTVSTVYNRDRYIGRSIYVPNEVSLTIEDCEVALAQGVNIIVAPGASFKAAKVLFHGCGNEEWGSVVITGTASGGTVSVGGTVSITGSVFKGSDYPIILNYSEGTDISENIFSGGLTAITLNHSENFNIEANWFYFQQAGIRTSESSGDLTSNISSNQFSDNDTCVIIKQGSYTDLNITCNNFDYNEYAVYSDATILKDQGDAETGPGNNFSTSSTNVNHRFRHSGNNMTYYCDANITFTLAQNPPLSAATSTAQATATCPRIGESKPNLSGEEPISMNEHNSNRIQVLAFPNPFNDELTIHYQLPPLTSKSTLKIVEASSGKIVFSTEVDIKLNTLVLDHLGLANGVYICSMTTEEGFSKQFKLISIR
jgi:hypothetical protein